MKEIGNITFQQLRHLTILSQGTTAVSQVQSEFLVSPPWRSVTSNKIGRQECYTEESLQVRNPTKYQAKNFHKWHAHAINLRINQDCDSSVHCNLPRMLLHLKSSKPHKQCLITKYVRRYNLCKRLVNTLPGTSQV